MCAERLRPPSAAARFTRAAHKVRIIGGRYRRTPLPVAEMAGLRPTPDRVRETLFNWLTHLHGDLAGTRGLDLFAGTGVLGFELASRGAAAVTLVENDAKLAEQLRRIRDRLAAVGVEVVRGDALAVCTRLPRAAFDVVFIDPPYDAQLQVPALRAVAPLLNPHGSIYVEAAQPLQEAALLEELDLAIVRQMRAGRVHAQVLQRRQG